MLLADFISVIDRNQKIVIYDAYDEWVFAGTASEYYSASKDFEEAPDQMYVERAYCNAYGDIVIVFSSDWME